MLRAVRMRGLACAVIIAAPFFVFAQNSSVLDLERELAEQKAEYAARLKSNKDLEARIAALEAARLQSVVDANPDLKRRSAKHISPNFEVTAPTHEIAEKVCLAAEREWAKGKFGNLNFSAPCKIRVRVGQISAGGATTFNFGGGEVFGWDMTVQGSLERILDSVIPHEVRHMQSACLKRRPLPRWLDEGSASLCEIDSERNLQLLLAKQIAGTSRFIPLRELLSEMHYAPDMQKTLALYAEGTALSDFLVTRAAATSSEQWTQKEAWQWMMDFEDIAYKKGWDAALYDIWKKEKSLGNITNIAQLSNEFTKWLKSGDAQIYSFNDEPSVIGQDMLLPVKYFDSGKNQVVPAN